MQNHRIIDKLSARGLLSHDQTDLWRGVCDLVSVLDAIGRDGAIAMIKIDGSRTSSSIYTVVISGSRLGDRYFRKDGSNLSEIIWEALDFYDEFLEDEKKFF